MPVVQSSFVVTNALGMHARPSALFAKTAARYDARVSVRNGGGFVDGKSILDLLTIGAQKGTKLTVVADGSDADALMQDIRGLFDAAFGEK